MDKQLVWANSQISCNSVLAVRRLLNSLGLAEGQAKSAFTKSRWLTGH